jgi:hypothetical protein
MKCGASVMGTPPRLRLFSTRVRLAVCLAITLVIACSSVSPAASAPGLASGFCRGTLVRDYLKPLRRMRPVRQVPASGRLPFGPKGLSLYALNRLRVGKGAIGFAFSDEAINQPRRLNWRIETKLMRVDSTGHVVALLATKTRHVGTQEVSTINGQRFVVSGKPSYYRVDITLLRLSGAFLGRYSEYFRVVRPTLHVHVMLSDKSVSPGQVIYARVENVGTKPVLPASRALIEQYEGGVWTQVATALIPGLRSRVRAVLYGGEIGRCVQYRVPVSQPPGRYRFTDKVARLKPVGGPQLTLAEEFQVGLESGG